MAIPIRNTVRSAAVKSPYAQSYINTPSGASITGEVRQYQTYKEMMLDPAPTRLASVINGSMDKDYPVPSEHVGGVLYQRDSVNNTWILLYTTSDLTVPTRIDWNNILNVPKWVGGISNNRVKLIQNAYADTRTTYYSYGNYILVLPDPATVNLGDQIALEQYNGFGAVCYPYAPGEENDVLANIDATLATTQLYHVIYTYADHEYTRDENGKMVIDTTKPINHNLYLFTCTETEVGNRIWRFNSNDAIENLVVHLRQEHFSHLRNTDPHHQYIRKTEVRNYISSLVELSYELPDATTYRLGGVYLGTVDDVLSNVQGNRSVTCHVLNNILSNYSVVNHNHILEGLANVSGIPSDGQVLIWDNTLTKWVPRSLSASSVIYGTATTTSQGIVQLATSADIESAASGAVVPNAQVISSYLSMFRKKVEHDAFVNLTDVNITSLVNGKILTVRDDKIVCGDYPSATTDVRGGVFLANDMDISAGTMINTKAVTPVQLINTSSKIMSEVEDMLINSGYVLPPAGYLTLGGVKIITDGILDMIYSDYPHYSSHLAESTTVVGVMQFVNYLHTVSASVSSATAAATSTALLAVSTRIDSVGSRAIEATSNANIAITSMGTLSSAITSKVNNLSSAYVSVDWKNGSNVTVSAQRISAADQKFYTVPKNGFIVFRSIPELVPGFITSMGNGNYNAAGFIDGCGIVHHALIAVSNNAFNIGNTNITNIPVNSGDKIYYTLTKESSGITTYFTHSGFTVHFYPGK